MNKVMMSLAGVAAMAAAAFAEGNTPPEGRLQRNEVAVAGPESVPTVRPTEGVRPARKRFSSAAIARIYDSTWKAPAPPLEGAPATSAKTKAVYDKSFGPRLTPMDGVAALPIAPPLAPVAPMASSIAPAVPMEPVAPVLAPVMPDMVSIGDELGDLGGEAEDSRLLEDNTGAAKFTGNLLPPSDEENEAAPEDGSAP